jgi:hypothetical protein
MSWSRAVQVAEREIADRHTENPEQTPYNVFVRAEDGRHRITDEPVIFEEANRVAREWLGPVATWTSTTRAISMYGSVLTIEEYSEEDDDGT